MYFTRNIGFTFSPYADNSFEITPQEWESLLLGQAAGKIITSGKAGRPFLAEPPKLTRDEERAVAEAQCRQLRKRADAAIAPLQDAADFGIITCDEKQELEAWKLYRIALTRLDMNQASNIKWPDCPVGETI